MHLKSLHTIWLTLFTTLVLLVSSVANSEPLMNIQMMSTGMAHHPSMMSDSEHCGMPGMMDVSMTDASMSEDGDARETSMNCGGGSGMVHTCCTAACTIVFVSLPNPVNSPIPVVYRATITPEVASPVVHVSRDLYRPPIA
ncbi:TPA: hypothetical protein ACPJ1X_004725 [Vibrio alginolyticus]|uniref:hypothetical protein n=1 Tax=Vibrio TaxID=662 RepID=UPI002964A907|nr:MULTISPECIES: hypothetical protein [unclassified Vibrio]EMD1211790.1 hypothetical protein [Vibrio alginolyticus]MDW1813309.1 hypothetical protein [Vibrio sp. Vb2362]EMD1213927.1 hypothetical protein [Vibrio alginolyticus]MDW1742144.1 hypothetical protein [Vibrio sp. Vb2531]MDW1873853.1 hypothetical protein [Vibrio sp. Vb1026]